MPLFNLLRIAVITALPAMIITSCNAQNYTPACVGFYNIENLFDTLDTPDVNDSEYTPKSAKAWNTTKYNEKLVNMARVLGELGSDVHPDGLFAFGLSEVENRQVVEDLIHTEPLKKRKYEIIHYDSPDKRGIDVAFAYQPKHFNVYNHDTYTLKIEGEDDFFTRDQLVVSGVLNGSDTIHMLVAHWPSRRGGEKRSSPKRMAAAELGRSIIDSLFTLNPKAKIIYMGDLNDDPIDKSVKRGLRTEGKQENAVNGRLFNPMEDLYAKGIGSLAYRDIWNLFDQVILSESLATKNSEGFFYYSSRVYNKPYLRQKDGNFAGYPYRTYVGDTYKGGFSDHFPVYVVLVKEESKD